ncbi:DUF4232 domain-containing protein [Actinospica sp.]|uniref:DUF4232 domain-containing protein n=1 Tax=Actinospica sp. TaxID=1872142 RepID=UPI002C7EBD7F|nr:DUF4232 domain-containing protein [Actinospica sp.]HWG22852.1 DUF4232 domain-containing protein [Actinospica sp.]
MLNSKGERGTTEATAVASSIATASGAGSGAPTGTGNPTTTPTTVSTSTADACAAAALNLQVTASSAAGYVGGGGYTGGSTKSGHHSLIIVTRTQQLTLTFTNVSHIRCTLRGYPSVDFLRGGIKGPLSAPDSFAPKPGVTDVYLLPGNAATAQVTFTANGADNPHGARCDQVIAVRVYAPGTTKALTTTARDMAGHRIPSFYVCGHKVVVHAVQHG